MKRFAMGTSLMACALAMSTTVYAQDIGGTRVTPTLAAPDSGEQAYAQRNGVAADFGTGTNILQIPAAAFIKRHSSTVVNYASNGYYWWTGSPTTEIMNAAVFLPAGAAVDWLDAYVCDSDAANDMTFIMRGYTGWTSPSYSDVVALTPNTSAGCDYFPAPVNGIFGPPHTINNDVRYGGGSQYVILLTGPATGNSNLRFKGVDLWWRRQISPAPLTATFTDVPTGAQLFREVEALAASGITSGCNATQFCPDSPVTRRQMAAFLARALGLSYQY